LQGFAEASGALTGLHQGYAELWEGSAELGEVRQGPQEAAAQIWRGEKKERGREKDDG